jgi:histidinol dehydrogenase
MKKYIYNDLTEEQTNKLCRRPKMDFESVFDTVRPIIDAVRSEGDEGVLKYSEKFDGFRPTPLVIDPGSTQVSLDNEIKEAIDLAFKNIYRFHKTQLPNPMEVETMPGVRCMRVARPIERVGLYVPGGTALLPSTLMMLGIPAALAGCKEIIIATPPGKNDRVPDELLYISKKIGASAILKAGGAQAVAAMAYGTESVSKTDKIFGPGNQYVTAAKMLLQNSEAQIAIDMPAGPSEVLIIADNTAEPAFVAADLLSQAEHGGDSQVVLLGTPGFDWETCEAELQEQLSKLPRQKIAAKALDHSFSLEFETLEEAFIFSNNYAPEHLIIQCENAENYVDQIDNAGSVFLGKWSPESVGDYASGTNHTLPTYGYARMYSGVSVDSFYKFITMQHLSEDGLKAIAPAVETLAELEELEGHKRAVSIRLRKN